MKSNLRFAWLTACVLVVGCYRAAPPAAGGGDAVVSAPGGAVVHRSIVERPGPDELRAQAEAAAAARPGAPPALIGQVEFPEAGRTVQAGAGQVINYATVSFIDTSSDQTVAATVTNSTGGFNLALGGFAPVPGQAYLVEATKGLDNNLPGSENPRFRTIVLLDAATNTWKSITTPSVVISNLSTAVAIESGLYSDKIPPEKTMGKVFVGIRPAALNQDPYFTSKNPPDPLYSGHPDSEITKLASDINTFLANDLDPVASVPEVVPTLLSLGTSTGQPKDIVKINGTGFSPVLGGNTVTFNGVAATLLLASPTVLYATVPDTASTGPVQVKTGRGTTTTQNFTVPPSGPTFGISFVYPDAGGPGTTVTILGFGFDKTAANNTVYFGTGSTQCTSSDVNFCVAKVPDNATAGDVYVTVTSTTPPGTSNTLSFTLNTAPVLGAAYPLFGAPGQEISIAGSNFGSVAGSVKLGNVDAPIVSWTDTSVVAEAPLLAQVGAGELTLAKPGGSRYPAASFGLLSSDIKEWTNTNDTKHQHCWGWMARYKNYLYTGGGAGIYTGDPGWNTVEKTRLDDAGNVSAWEVMPGVSLPFVGVGYSGYDLAHQAQIIGDRAYAINGGWNNMGGQKSAKTIMWASINPETGMMSNFTAAPITLANPVSAHHFVTRVRNYVYVFGGNDPGNSKDIQGAKIDPVTNMLGNFKVEKSLAAGFYAATAVHVGRYVYILGGTFDGEGWSAKVRRATIDKDGWLTSNFTDTGKDTPVTLYQANASVIGGYVYLIGGQYNSIGWLYDVYRSPINPADDSLGPWEKMPATLSLHQHSSTVMVVGSKVYGNGHWIGSTMLVGTIK